MRAAIELIESDPDVGLIERPEHKRRWDRHPGRSGRREALTQRRSRCARRAGALGGPAAAVDRRAHGRAPARRRDLSRPRAARRPKRRRLRGDRCSGLCSTRPCRISRRSGSPKGPAQAGECGSGCGSSSGRGPRREDRPHPGPADATSQADFRSAIYWKHRGKLDVPKERFVLDPERRARRRHVVPSSAGLAGTSATSPARSPAASWSYASRRPLTPSV